MYHNVYLHKTTRGFEKLLETMWSRARGFFDQGRDALVLPSIRDFWSTSEPTVAQYLAIEEFTVLQQIQYWTMHDDKALDDSPDGFSTGNAWRWLTHPISRAG